MPQPQIWLFTLVFLSKSARHGILTGFGKSCISYCICFYNNITLQLPSSKSSFEWLWKYCLNFRCSFDGILKRLAIFTSRAEPLNVGFNDQTFLIVIVDKK